MISSIRSCKLFGKGDRNSSSLHEHVILPKQLTDDLYSTWTQCYDELFHASLLPKYVPRKTSSDPSYGQLNKRSSRYIYSLSEMNIADHISDRENAEETKLKKIHRFSLDISNTNIALLDSPLKHRHRLHLSDPEPTLKAAKCVPPTTDKTNFGKLFGRKKVYKLSETTS